MHPFYGPSGRQWSGSAACFGGLASMAAYLAFWAVALAVARHELDARWPRRPGTGADRDPALSVVRERFARGELDEAQFRALMRALREEPGGEP